MFMDASSALEEKGLFFSKNHLFPFMRFTTQRGQERECGSITSNNKAREEAHKDNKNHETGQMDATKYGFPFAEMKCHSTFVKNEF